MENIVSEIKNFIADFNIRRLHRVLKVIIDNGKEISLLLEFEYISFIESKKKYQFGILFKNFKMQNGLDFEYLLNIDNLKIKNISDFQWEKIYWHIIDEDDDGSILFEFYCEDISLEFVRQDEKILYEKK